MALREFQEKKIARRVVFSAPVLLALIIFSSWIIYGTVSAGMALYEISKKNAELEKKISDVQRSKKNLEKSANLLDTDYGIDLEARSKFNLKKPGEGVILFVDD